MEIGVQHEIGTLRKLSDESLEMISIAGLLKLLGGVAIVVVLGGGIWLFAD